MFSKLFTKLNSFGDHHQILLAILIAFGIIAVTWGTEKILEHYLFPQNPLYGYLTAIIGGLFVLWLTKHFILHVI